MSCHSSPYDIIQIIRTKKIDGITISYSVLTPHIYEPVLSTASDLGVGVITMNSLGGGIIPQNPDIFSFIKQEGDETISEAALTWSYAHPQITTVLAGITSFDELRKDIHAFSYAEDPVKANKRIITVNEGFRGVTGFCTGCGYCTSCPAKIDIPAFMQSYNTIQFPSGIMNYQRTDNRLMENIRICYKLNMISNFIPIDAQNPCQHCHQCEKKCTQKLPIIERISELYQRFDEAGYSNRYITDRLKSIFDVKYTRIAFWPAGYYSQNVIAKLKEVIPKIETELLVFDGNEKLWDTYCCGIKIYNPARISDLKPDIIVISNYIYLDEIYESIKYFEDIGIKVIKLHKPQDVPWVF
jgi:ferredoxin